MIALAGIAFLFGVAVWLLFDWCWYRELPAPWPKPTTDRLARVRRFLVEAGVGDRVRPGTFVWLCVGLGLGWNKDEMDATGADMKRRGALADEFLPLLKAIWTTNPVEFHGKFFNVPKSYINLKPVQKPHPPIYLGAFVPAALKRLAKLADGWNPVFLPVPVMAEMFGNIKQMAKEAGRDPSALVMVVHAIIEITEKPLDKDRVIFSGSLEQISEDVGGCAKIGADEVFFDPAFAPGGQSLDRWLSLLDQLQGMMTVS